MPSTFRSARAPFAAVLVALAALMTVVAAQGRAAEADLPLLERLAATVKSAAVCGMGAMAPGAAMATLEHFRDEFDAHVRRGQCPAGVCAMSPTAAGSLATTCSASR